MSTVLTDYALSRTSWAPKLILPLNDGSGTTAADAATSPVNGTYLNSPTLTNATPAYGNESDVTAMTTTQAGTAFARVPTAGKLSHLVDGTVSYTILGVIQTDAANPNPFNFPVQLGFQSNAGSHDNWFSIILNSKADLTPHGQWASFMWYTVANGATGSQILHSGSVFDGNRHTFAAVYSTAAGGTLKFYLDGVLGSVATGVNSKAPALQTYLGIGASVNSDGTTIDRAPAQGTFSDIQYFETELTLAQIQGWHSRALNGDNRLYDGTRRFMAIHVIDGDYTYTGGLNESAVVTGGTILASPVINASSVGSIADSPDYGYILSGSSGTPDPVQMGTNIAAAVVAAVDLNKPCVIACNCLMRQALNTNAIALGYDTEPSTTDLFNLIKSGTHSASAIAAKARINLMMPTLVAGLGDVLPTAIYSNDEDLPVYDVCFNTPGALGVALQAMYASLLADTTMQARIADVRAEGADTDNHALDALIAAACYAESLWMLDALPTVPLAYYFRGRVTVPRYAFRYNGGSVAAVGVTEATLGCWAYQNNALDAETIDLLEDLAAQGQVVQTPVLDVRVNNGDAAYRTRLESRLNACRDRGLNDVLFYVEQGTGNADTDLTYVSSILAAAQVARMSVPVLQSASVSIWGVATFELDVDSTFDGTDKDDGISGLSLADAASSGDGTTTITVAVQAGGSYDSANPTYRSESGGSFFSDPGGLQSDSVSGFPCPISGIVSAVFDEGSLTLTLTLVEGWYDGMANSDDLKITSTDGTKYQYGNSTAITSDTVRILTVEAVAGDGSWPTAGTMSALPYVFNRNSDDAANIAISNYPITVIPIPSTGSLFRERLPRTPVDFRARR